MEDESDKVEMDGIFKNRKTLAHWTIIDQKRLISFDGLHGRLLEYHNNIHLKDTQPSANSNQMVDAPDTSMVAQVFHCVDENSIQRPYPLTQHQLTLFLQQVQVPASDTNTGCLWIHMKELSVLPQIAKKFNMHELCVSGFEDLRCHSCMIPTVGAALYIFCTHQMEQTDLTMYKLFIYAAKGLVVTYQKEILPDLTEEDKPPIDTIVDSVLMNYKKLFSKCLHLGSMYVVYELAQQALMLQDSAMEYLSCALTYFNRIVHLNLLHREKLDIMLKMHIIASSSILMQRSVQELEAMFATFVSVALGEPLHSNNANNNSVSQSAAMSNSNLSNNGYGLKRLLCPALIEDAHIPYLVDLSDSYLYVSSCLQNIINETARLDQELDATIQIRSSNTNILLSLIATTFLPLTFLAGVFGMNFEKHAEYTIELLNMQSGPLIFSIMCVVCFLISVTYFLAQGWIEIAFIRKLYKKINPNKIDDSRKAASPNAMRRAELEEARREKAKKFRKTLSLHHTHALRRRTASGHSANGSYNHSSNTSFNSHQNPLLMSDYFSETDLSGRVQPGSSPDIPIHRNLLSGGSYVQPHVDGIVRESEDSVPSVAMSGVSLGSGFLGAVPERLDSKESSSTTTKSNR